METRTIVPREKKLQNLRRILLIASAVVVIPVVSLMLAAFFFLSSRLTVAGAEGVAGMGRTAALPLYLLLGMGALVTVAVIAAVCLAIYYVVKHRLDQDEEIFL